MGGAGVIAIALSVLCLIVSFVFAVPSWVNLLGIGFGIVGLVLLGRARKGGGGDGGL
ncbi:hypothetical protein [Roseovarius aestuariivivens]|uniref:hypothetical protein n=1 Tax=Roseovarius aestuariivivens TaxID=1888910 RepID=UPI0014368084|nr:hypothetical protein [Roseovarius aestuariivivens]